MNIRYITKQEQFDQAIKELREIPKLCADFETTGLDARVHEPRLLQLCTTKEVEDRTVYVIDFFKVADTSALEQVITTRELLVLHNANFDVQFFLKLGIDYKGKIFDTFVADRCLTAGFKERKINPK